MKGTILSIEVNNIGINNHINSVQNNKVVAFKSNTIPSDSIELSTKKKELSIWSKIGIGVGIVSIIGLGAELIWGKGKHLKSEKTNCSMGENICKRCDHQSVNIQNILTAHTTQF